MTFRGFATVLECIKEERYDDVIPLCNEEIDCAEPDVVSNKLEALLLRATFYFLLGQHDTAIADFGTIINNETVPKNIKVNALIKRATLYMQLESPEKSICDFKVAVELDPDCGDIYSNKGQVIIRSIV